MKSSSKLAAALLAGLMPLASTGVDAFRTAHPTYDGRGVLVGILDSGIDPGVAGLIVGFGVTSGFGVIGNFSVIKKNFDITDLPETFYDIPDSFTGAGQTLIVAAQPGTHYTACAWLNCWASPRRPSPIPSSAWSAMG